MAAEANASLNIPHAIERSALCYNPPLSDAAAAQVPPRPPHTSCFTSSPSKTFPPHHS